MVAASTDRDDGNAEDRESRTELDTHANMPVVGRDVLIVADVGKTVEVNPFTPDYPAMTVRLVDAALKYECPYTGVEYLLLIRNAVYVPSMRGGNHGERCCQDSH